MKDKVKILVVEDEMPMAMMMVHILHHAGCEAEAAWSGEKALQLAQTMEFDLVTLDISLPGMNGFEICQRLKELPHLRDTPIVFVSGRLDGENRRLAFQAGAADFIEKPFQAQDFLARVLTLVEETTLV
jgi:DNA-binding response OmpR family regulator